MRYSLLLLFVITLFLTACDETPTSDKETKIPSSSVTQDDDITQTVTGTILDLEPIYIDKGGLVIYLEDKDGKGYYLDFYREVNPEKYDQFPEDFEVEIQAFYKAEKQQIALDIQSLGKIGGKVVDDYKDLVVYMVKGTQTAVEKKDEGLIVTIETNKGTTLEYLADEETYGGAKPEAYNGQKIEVIYQEDEQLLMQDYEVIIE